MEEWQSISLGAFLAAFAAVVAETARYFFTRKRERDERQHMFQRDRLLSLLDHLAAFETATTDYFYLSKRSGDWTTDPNSKHLAAMSDAVALARRDWVVLDDGEVRDWAEDAAIAALGLPAADSMAAAQALFDAYEEINVRLFNRIGKLVRGL